jgi:hypothetical protein
MIAGTQFARVEQHYLASDGGKVVLKLEVVEHRTLRHNVFQQCAQSGNVPLSMPNS